MSCFLDTSFLCSVCRTQAQSPRSDAFMAKRTAAIPVSSLLLLEFRQSIRFQVRLHSKEKTKGFPKHEATQMLQDLYSDLKSKVLEVVPADWSAVHQVAEDLSARYTEHNGHRFADIPHALGFSEKLLIGVKGEELPRAEMERYFSVFKGCTFQMHSRNQAPTPGAFPSSSCRNRRRPSGR